MCAKPNNNAHKKNLKLIPSKSLSLEYIKSRDGDFFNCAGVRLIMLLLDGAIEKCRQNIILGVYPADGVTRDILCGEIYNALKSDYVEKLGTALSLVNVVNATGIVVHTNLGRAPLARHLSSYDPCRYSNIEFDIETGLRSRRDDHLTGLILALTGAEDAITVNNNAAAALLISAALADGGEIMVRRSESVEIGEGFRISEMLKAGGARIVDVGATNSCTLADYESLVTPETKIAARIHASNYKISGYIKDFADEDFLEFCAKFGLISYYDLGSGLLTPAFLKNPTLVSGETGVCGLINSGFDIVSFSGDKLLGSVQCGIICGKKDIITVLRKTQIYRALRVSKDVVASLQATLASYLFADYEAGVPAVGMLNETSEAIGERCNEFFSALCRLESYKKVASAKKMIEISIDMALTEAGGGALPEKKIENPAIFIKMASGAPGGLTLEYISRAMRVHKHHIIGYIDSGAYILNLRTVLAAEIPLLIEALDSLFSAIAII